MLERLEVVNLVYQALVETADDDLN